MKGQLIIRQGGEVAHGRASETALATLDSLYDRQVRYLSLAYLRTPSPPRGEGLPARMCDGLRRMAKLARLGGRPLPALPDLFVPVPCWKASVDGVLVASGGGMWVPVVTVGVFDPRKVLYIRARKGKEDDDADDHSRGGAVRDSGVGGTGAEVGKET